jgi:excinuclease ABC subunit A
MGPEGGGGGGRIVAEGTPEQVADNPDSHTGRYLKALLGKTKDSGRHKTRNQCL